MTQLLSRAAIFLMSVLLLSGCAQNETPTPAPKTVETPEYFSLRPETEKAYGYTHAVKIGNAIKVSGAVSMDDKGVPTATGDLL